jgi:hypothetical protein
MNEKREIIKVILDIEVNAIFQMMNHIARAAAFYLAIFAAIISYFLTQDIPAETKKGAILVGLIVSILAAIIGIVVLWGIHNGVNNVKQNLKELDKDLFYKLEVDKFFNRGQNIAFVGGICTFVLLIVFSIILIKIL